MGRGGPEEPDGAEAAAHADLAFADGVDPEVLPFYHHVPGPRGDDGPLRVEGLEPAMVLDGELPEADDGEPRQVEDSVRRQAQDLRPPRVGAAARPVGATACSARHAPTPLRRSICRARAGAWRGRGPRMLPPDGLVKGAWTVSVVNVIELVADAETGWVEAVQHAVREAARTVRHITGVEITNLTAVVEGGRITSYRANVHLAFEVEPPEERPTSARTPGM